jgi:UPF0755 protein
MKKWASAIVAVLALAASVLIYANLRHAYRAYSGSVVLVINPGMRSPEVTDLLVARGVLHYHLPFFILSALGRPRHRWIKAGEYLFDQPLTPLEVYRRLVQGDVYLHTVLIPEGTDRFEMARIFQEQLGIDPVNFLRATQVTGLVRDLDPQAPSLEGFLFPDTYRFPRGASSAAVVTTMLARFRHVLESHFPELRQSPEKLHDGLTLASLVEKETPVDAERPEVAGVFENRLQKGMMLQCDPSVVYAARLDRLVSASIEGKMNVSSIAPVSETITQDELRIDSPYNTYIHAGLPRGPICSPGQASLRASLNPASVSSLYFVSNNRGGHLFASTLVEHQRNVARYRRGAAAGASGSAVSGPAAGASSAPTSSAGGAGATGPAAPPSSTTGQAATPQPPPEAASSNGRKAPRTALRRRSLSHSGRHRGRHKKHTLPKQEDAHS